MRNLLINGDFQIWQRGTEFHPQNHLQYTADRWNADWQWGTATLGQAKISRQMFPIGQVEVPGNPKYFLRWEQQTPSSGTGFRDLSQQIDDVSTFSGQQVTLSCYLRADRPATIRLVTEQFFGGGGGSHPEFTESQIFNVTSQWQRYSYSPILNSVAGKLVGSVGDDSLNFIVSQKNQSAIDPLTLDIADCQIESGSVLTPFDRQRFSHQLAEAERYFQKSYNYDTAPGAIAFAGSVNTRQVSAFNVTSVHFRRAMRRTPRVTLFNPATGAVNSWSSLGVDVDVTAGDIGTNYFHVDASNGINGEPLAGHWTAEAEFA